MTSSSCQVRFSGGGSAELPFAARLLADTLVREGRAVALSHSASDTVLGGLARYDLVIGSDAADYPLATALDYVVLLNQQAAHSARPLLKSGALVLADVLRVPEPPEGAYDTRTLAFANTARAVGNERLMPVAALGALVAASGLTTLKALEQTLATQLPPDQQTPVLAALRAGAKLGAG